MARQVLPVAGAIIGGIYGGPQGAQWGWAIGSVVGNAVDPQVLAGPRIGEVSAQTSQEGVPRPIIFGLSPPIPGNIIATSEPRIVRRTESQGKGGPKVETESVYRTYAIRICEGPIQGFVQVWRNGILVYDANPGSSLNQTTALTGILGVIILPSQNQRFLARARYFNGAFDQNPSPDLESIYGVGTTPAHRGTAYMVMADDDLTDMRGAIPQYVFRVSTAGELDCEEVQEFSNEILPLWPEGGQELVDPRDGDTCPKFEYRFDRGGANGYSPPLAGDAGSLEAAAANATTSSGVPITLPADIYGWNRRNDTGEGIFPYNSVISTTRMDYKRWFFLNEHVPTGISNAQWSNGGGGPTFHEFASFNNLDNKWWSGNEAIGQAHHGVLHFTAPDNWSTHPDVTIEVRLVPRAPYSPCDLCGGGFPVSTIEGYCIDLDGNYYEDTSWALHSTTYNVLQKTVLDADFGEAGTYTKLPLSPARPIGHPEYDDQDFWESAYDAAVTAGAIAPGLTYGVDYPESQSFGYSITYDRCIFFGATVPLAEVVEQICARAGLTQVDVSQLEGEVRGFAITNAYAAYETLKVLSEVFQFDPSNYDGQIHFIPRGGNSVATITEEEMVEDENDIEQQKRSDAISIPRVLHLNYHDVAGGLNTDKQSSERAGDRRSVGELSLQTAVVLNANEAARVVDINHKVLIEDQKGELKFALPDNQLRLVVADPIIVQWQGRSERCRITQIDTHEGYQDCTVVRDRQSAYTSNVEGIPAAPQTSPPSSVPGPTLIEPLDIHTIRDADDFLGYYVAISGMLDAWQGATIELSLDGGQNYVDSTTWTTQAVMGRTITVLGDHPRDFPDEVHTVRVGISTPHAELLETDLAGLLNRQNLSIINDELINFANADEVEVGVWDLSYFLRGRKGSGTQEHIVGSRFVLLSRSVIPFVPAELSDLNRVLTFRATSFGDAPDAGTVVSMSYTGKSQTELSPAYLEAHLEIGDAVISWQGIGSLGSGAQVAHGAYFSGYRVTVTDGSLTETVDTVNQTLTHDVSGFSDPVTIRVQQRNQLTGLGQAIEVTIANP